MDEAKAQEIKQWLIKADHDLGSARRLAEGDNPYLDTAAYHCQQTAEKALKAYLTFRDMPFQRVHDLAVLIEQCMETDKTFDQIRNIADILNPYATAFRYPGDVLEPNPLDVEEALRLAGVVLDFILERIPGGIKENKADFPKPKA